MNTNVTMSNEEQLQFRQELLKAPTDDLYDKTHQIVELAEQINLLIRSDLIATACNRLKQRDEDNFNAITLLEINIENFLDALTFQHDTINLYKKTDNLEQKIFLLDQKIALLGETFVNVHEYLEKVGE